MGGTRGPHELQLCPKIAKNEVFDHFWGKIRKNSSKSALKVANKWVTWVEHEIRYLTL